MISTTSSPLSNSYPVDFLRDTVKTKRIPFLVYTSDISKINEYGKITAFKKNGVEYDFGPKDLFVDPHWNLEPRFKEMLDNYEWLSTNYLTPEAIFEFCPSKISPEEFIIHLLQREKNANLSETVNSFRNRMFPHTQIPESWNDFFSHQGESSVGGFCLTHNTDSIEKILKYKKAKLQELEQNPSLFFREAQSVDKVAKKLFKDIRNYCPEKPSLSSRTTETKSWLPSISDNFEKLVTIIDALDQPWKIAAVLTSVVVFGVIGFLFGAIIGGTVGSIAGFCIGGPPGALIGAGNGAISFGILFGGIFAVMIPSYLFRDPDLNQEG